MDSTFKKKLINSTLITSSGTFVSVILLFLGSIILTRSTSQDELGTFFLLMAVWMFLQMIGNLGLDATLVKYISNLTAEEIDLTFNKFFLVRIVSLVLISILYISFNNLFYFISPALGEYSYFVVLIFSLDSLRSFFNAELQGRKEFKVLISVHLLHSTSKILLYIIGIYFNILNVSFLLLSEIISIMISFIIQRSLSKLKIRITFNIKLSELRNLFAFTLPIYMNNILNVFSVRSNSFIIASFTNTSSVAYYEVGKKIPDGFSRLSTSIVMVFFPFISELISNNNTNDAKILIKKYIYYISLFYAPVVMIVLLFRQELVLLLFSDKYLITSLALLYFTISFYFNFLSTIIGYSLVAGNKPLFSFYINLGTTVIAIILSLIFVPIFGYIGAVYSVVFSSVLNYLISLLGLKTISMYILPIKSFTPFLLILPFIFLINYFPFFYSNLISKSIIVIIFILLEILLFKDFKDLLISSILKTFSKIKTT